RPVAVLRDRLANHSQPDDGPRGPADRAVYDCLPCGPGLHRRYLRVDDLRRPGFQPGAVRRLVGAAARSISPTLQSRVPRRSDELRVRHWACFVGACCLGVATGTDLAAATRGFHRVRAGAVLLPSFRGRALRYGGPRRRAAALVGDPRAPARGTEHRLRCDERAVSAGGAAAPHESDLVA